MDDAEAAWEASRAVAGILEPLGWHRGARGGLERARVAHRGAVRTRAMKRVG